jgi:uncharacterized protein YggU (UPF0235/DUF167 family)
MLVWTYGSIPERAPLLKGLEEHRLSLLVTKIVTEGKANAHGTKTRDWDFQVPETH